MGNARVQEGRDVTFVGALLQALGPNTGKWCNVRVTHVEGSGGARGWVLLALVQRLSASVRRAWRPLVAHLPLVVGRIDYKCTGLQSWHNILGENTVRPVGGSGDARGRESRLGLLHHRNIPHLRAVNWHAVHVRIVEKEARLGHCLDDGGGGSSTGRKFVSVQEYRESACRLTGDEDARRLVHTLRKKLVPNGMKDKMPLHMKGSSIDDERLFPRSGERCAVTIVESNAVSMCEGAADRRVARQHPMPLQLTRKFGA
mmetsp:Transcript_13030/g.41113  ORF Transcript_13030/g.41113 Transcript_13030/m.41113 type:complete len:258 (+) Transcript_13030:511-1284(+)